MGNKQSSSRYSHVRMQPDINQPAETTKLFATVQDNNQNVDAAKHMHQSEEKRKMRAAIYDDPVADDEVNFPRLAASAETALKYERNSHSKRRNSHNIESSRVVSQSTHITLRSALNGLTPEDIREHIHEIEAPSAIVPRSPSLRSVPLEMSLLTIMPESVPGVPYKDIPVRVYIYNVHDGDTVHFLMSCGLQCGHVLKLSLRLLGIDTPELRAGEGRLAEEKTAGEMARNRLAELINSRIAKEPRAKPRRQTLTTIIIRDWDKFGGRVLGEIFLPNGRSASDIMITEGFGRHYNGDKKAPWTMEDLSRAPFKLI